MNSYNDFLQAITELYDQNKLDFNNFNLLKKEIKKLECIHEQDLKNYKIYLKMLEHKIKKFAITGSGITEIQVQNIVSNYITSHKDELIGDINYITSPDGSKFKIIVSNNGVMSTEKISSGSSEPEKPTPDESEKPTPDEPEKPTPDEPEKPSSSVQIVDFYCGNAWENVNYKFKEGYKYELTPVPDCNFNNLTKVTTINATSEESSKDIRGHYKIKTLLGENETNPPVNFVRSSASILYPLVTKINGLKDIVFIGDSLTDPNFSVKYGNYVKYLYEKYSTKYNFITQLATFGHTTDQQITVLNKYLTMFNGSSNGYFDITPDNDNVKIVSIFTGTNEINQDIDVSTFGTNYNNLINKVKETFVNAKIICITPFLCCKKSANINYINKVKEIATSNRCILCDLSLFTELDSVANGQNQYYLEEECIHLNSTGWNLVNPTIEAAYISASIKEE